MSLEPGSCLKGLQLIYFSSFLYFLDFQRCILRGFPKMHRKSSISSKNRNEIKVEVLQQLPGQGETLSRSNKGENRPKIYNAVRNLSWI